MLHGHAGGDVRGKATFPQSLLISFCQLTRFVWENGECGRKDGKLVLNIPKRNLSSTY